MSAPPLGDAGRQNKSESKEGAHFKNGAQDWQSDIYKERSGKSRGVVRGRI